MKIKCELFGSNFEFEGTLEEYLAVSKDTAERLGEFIDSGAVKEALNCFIERGAMRDSAALETFKAEMALKRDEIEKARRNI